MKPVTKAVCIVSIACMALLGGGVWWGYSHLTAIVQAQLKRNFGDEVHLGKITARWNRVELEQVAIDRHGPGPFARRLSVERIVIRPSIMSLFKRRLDLGELTVTKPYLLLEVAPNGAFEKILKQRSIPSGNAAGQGPPMPIVIGSIRVEDGRIDLLDWQVARKHGLGLSHPRGPYHLLTLDQVSLSAGALPIPLGEKGMPIRLSLHHRGGGTLSVTGDLTPKNLDASLKLKLTDLNITRFRPYFLKQGDLNVTAGTLSATSTINIDRRELNAPGVLSLRGLAFDHAGGKGIFLGLPAVALVKMMSDRKDDISVPFTLKGNLDNPRFVIRQSLFQQVGSALSAKLGVPSITSVGKGIMDIGGKGLKGLFGLGKGK